MVKDRGVFYIAFGAGYRAEARISARSVKAQMPDIPVALVTDTGPETDDCFDIVMLVSTSESPKRAKVEYMERAPFERVLFLDTDTFVCEPVGDVFDTLDQFEFAAVHAPFPKGVDYCEGGQIHHAGRPARSDALSDDAFLLKMFETPGSFYQVNSGVLAFRRTPSTQELLKSWLTYYDAGGIKKDQFALRAVLYRSAIRLVTLGTEYNLRTDWPACVYDKVKILHGRLPGDRSMENLGAKLNAKAGHHRVYWPPDEVITLGDRKRERKQLHNPIGRLLSRIWRNRD